MTPQEFKLINTMTATKTRKGCRLASALVDTNYSIQCEFSYDVGNYWITNKAVDGFVVNIASANVADKDFIVKVYNDTKMFNA